MSGARTLYERNVYQVVKREDRILLALHASRFGINFSPIQGMQSHTRCERIETILTNLRSKISWTWTSNCYRRREGCYYTGSNPNLEWWTSWLIQKLRLNFYTNNSCTKVPLNVEETLFDLCDNLQLSYHEGFV